jgi:nitrate reductase gamma subunit
MASFYAFLTGPALVISLLVFFGGLTYRLVQYFRGLDWRLDRVGYRTHMNRGMKGGLWSIYKWLLPFGTVGWRAQPFFTIFFFMLHFGAVLVPLFLVGHNVILKQNFGFSFPSLPQLLADVLTVGAILGLFFMAMRRIALPEVRIVTTKYDFFIIALVALPFVTGFIARMHPANYDFWLISHILTGHLMLILAPFTKLSHIVLFFGTRWQIGADFAIKRGGHSRGPCFPW